jgi:thioredoxin reductase (NADPH)
MEDTLALTKFAKEITIVHRRDSFKASKIMQDRVLAHPKVKVIWNSQVKEVKGEQRVQSLIIEDLNSHETKEIVADGLFVAVGHKPSTEIFANQIKLDDKGYVVTRVALEKQSLELASGAMDENSFVTFPTLTSVEGVFAAGDCVDFRYKQAITAAGFGCMAALDTEKWLENK